MRRYWEEQRPPSMLGGSLLLRLASGVGMLAIVALLIVRMGEPGMWRWLAGDDGPPAEKKSAHPPPIPAADGPTHEDPDQAETAREEFQALTDGSLNLQRIEMEPYYRLVYWARNQPFERLRRMARSDLLYTHFYDEAERYRGALVTMDLDVRQALDAGKGRDGGQLYELRGFTSASWGHPYFLVVVDYPKDMPRGPSINERVTFAGYFLKLQGYMPAEAKPGDPIEKAPLLIGRIEWKPSAAKIETGEEKFIDWVFRCAGTWGVISLLFLIVALMVGLSFAFMYISALPKTKRTTFPTISAASPSGEAMSIESWLGQPELNIDENKSCDEEDAAAGDKEDLDG